MTQFWDILQLIASTILFVAYLIVLFHVVVDLFRDPEIGGGYKAIWIIGLLFIPVLTVILYLLTRGGGMAERERAVYTQAKSDADAYIRQVAGKSPAEQIADAKALLDAGTINEAEYAKLKAKALN
ncbi:MAG: SHOCT domain-containing protein [Chromatiaceae bacterium]|nr:SHOCT domain-containing protein [Chromatiaceae bacterium]